MSFSAKEMEVHAAEVAFLTIYEPARSVYDAEMKRINDLYSVEETT